MMGMGGLGDMMKQVQKMQAKMAEMQAQLEQAQVEGSAGGGMVKVVANGKHEIISITIDPEVVDKNDVEMLQDLVVAAVNAAHQKVRDMQAEQMSQLTGGMNIPGLNLPF
ncbi:YbaB/EbfC family nucleoid-associated protein [candidate division GN15 bacterium]|uniref:Nucleoid-associated protein C3F09_03560 n=1 Tax=candidate division GN15 bacterium TaxID=2072418 RepID=A0A855X973_9BACT|nr:MAG: YbaB/EbfC family nucleoid-associated protein [candidate division GN15 bacterium]